MKRDLIIDCFAGGGGASVGIEMALGRSVDIAINHDPDAILMHKTNHPNTLHLTEDIFRVDLKKYVNEGKSNVEIAYLLDISVATVIAGVKAYGLKGMRKRGRPKKELIH